MNRKEILKDYLKVDPDEVVWSFISNYYDGPIEGLVYFKEQIRYCRCFEEDIPIQKTYVVLDLPQDILAVMISDKEEFERMVGTHWSFDKAGNRLPMGNVTEETSDAYYKSKKPEISPSIAENEIIAWFEYG